MEHVTQGQYPELLELLLDFGGHYTHGLAGVAEYWQVPYKREREQPAEFVQIGLITEPAGIRITGEHKIVTALLLALYERGKK